MRISTLILVAAVCATPARADPAGPYAGGGPTRSFLTAAPGSAAPGTGVSGPATDVPPALRARIQAEIRAFEAAHPAANAPEPLPVQPWLIFPQAGNLDEDIFFNTFVDVDPTSGVQDWLCGTRTYDGHQGLDSDIRSFAYQDLGVPVFAALDGTVVAAHDGEWDRHTSWLPDANPNYVTLNHSGGQYSLYLHLRKGSVAVAAGQTVKAGQQIGQTGSSGFSGGPHLHFESQLNGEPYDPFAGACRPGPSHWLRQPAVRTDMLVSELVVCDAYMETYAPAAFGWPRDATFTTGPHRVTNWFTLHNMPANTTWSVRYLRPGGAVEFSSPTFSFGNPAYTSANYWLGYDINLSVTGTWTSIVTLNGKTLPPTPFFVVANVNAGANHAPAAAAAVFDPAAPGPNDAVFCRVTSPLLNDDPDYDIVRYRYLWKVNGATVRDVTTAARSDAVPRGAGPAGATLTCEVTPTDGRLNGPAATVSAVLASALSGDVDGNGTLDRADVLLSLRIAGGLEAATAQQAARSGAGQGGISLADAVRLLRRIAP